MVTNKGKAYCLTARYSGATWWNSIERSQRTMIRTVNQGIINEKYNWRKLTPIECERLQTVPDNYTEGVSNSQRYKMLGNGWTVKVIEHVLTNMDV